MGVNKETPLSDAPSDSGDGLQSVFEGDEGGFWRRDGMTLEVCREAAGKVETGSEHLGDGE